jgi:hypothetical protein
MTNLGIRYLVAGLCVVCFILAQAFQELAYRLSIPTTSTLEDQLQAYLLPIDQARALAVAATILLLLVPYVVIAMRYIEVAPLASVRGLIFGAAFVGCEISYRSVEFLLVGMKWAREFQNASGIEREVILQRFTIWSDLVRGWYFPLLLAYMLGSCCFLAATWHDLTKGAWYRLGTTGVQRLTTAIRKL